MTMPKKGSRTVDVDGKPFRFMSREKTVYAPGEDQKELTVTVQEDVEKPGRLLQFKWPGGHAMTPDDVRNAVRDGVKAGWDPASKGGVFTLPTA